MKNNPRTLATQIRVSNTTSLMVIFMKNHKVSISLSLKTFSRFSLQHSYWTFLPQLISEFSSSHCVCLPRWLDKQEASVFKCWDKCTVYAILKFHILFAVIVRLIILILHSQTFLKGKANKIISDALDF